MAVHNLSSEPVMVDFALDPRDTDGEDPVWLEDLVATGAKQPRRDGTVEVALEGYDHRWYRLRRDDLPRR